MDSPVWTHDLSTDLDEIDSAIDQMAVDFTGSLHTALAAYRRLDLGDGRGHLAGLTTDSLFICRDSTLSSASDTNSAFTPHQPTSSAAKSAGTPKASCKSGPTDSPAFGGGRLGRRLPHTEGCIVQIQSRVILTFRVKAEDTTMADIDEHFWTIAETIAKDLDENPFFTMTGEVIDVEVR
jgi:hypothetical protein